MQNSASISPIKLRPHHLLCLQGFSGKGYSNQFIQNMQDIKDKLSAPNSQINMVFSSDDICACCPHLIAPGLCETADSVKIKDNKVIKYFKLAQKAYNYQDLINEIKLNITPSIMADICSDCAWYDNSYCRKNILGKVSNQDTREIIFKLIFERIVNNDTDNEDTFLLTTEILDEENLLRARNIYEQTAIKNKGEFLKSTIDRYANKFDIERLYKVDFAILILAAYEILFDEEMSYKIAANEAVLLSKKYSSEKSSKFINGILSSIIKDKETLLNECKNS